MTGPVFEAGAEESACEACTAWTSCDIETGLCVSCWRAWRWSPVGGERPRVVGPKVGRSEIDGARERRELGGAIAVLPVDGPGIGIEVEVDAERPRSPRR